MLGVCILEQIGVSEAKLGTVWKLVEQINCPARYGDAA